MKHLTLFNLSICVLAFAFAALVASMILAGIGFNNILYFGMNISVLACASIDLKERRYYRFIPLVIGSLVISIWSAEL